MAFTYAWDTDFGNNPEDTESRKYGAQQIRKFKDAVTERMQIDHEFGEEIIGSGVDNQTDTGYHKKVTLKNTGSGPSEPVTGYCAFAYDATANLLKYYPNGGNLETLVEKDETQTLTNKTLTSPTINGGSITSAAMASVDINSGNIDGTLIGLNSAAIAQFSYIGIGTAPDGNYNIKISRPAPYNVLLETTYLASSADLVYSVAGNKSGGSVAHTSIGVMYNSSSTSNQACSYLSLQASNSNIYYLWVDDTGDLRISATYNHIGTTSGTVIGTQS